MNEYRQNAINHLKTHLGCVGYRDYIVAELEKLDKVEQDLGKAATTAVAIIAEKMANISKRLEAIDWQEVYKNEQINITERKALLDMWDDVQSTQTPCNTREKE